ncbi:MAG: ABC transporter substrate-binding protein [Chitinivibrionales bacterium]
MNRNGLAFVPLILSFLTGCASEKSQGEWVVRESPKRVISMAPGITETIYSLGAQECLAGITRFCTYPPPTASVPKVGGYLDPNYEAIVRLKPDLVVLMKEHVDVKRFLTKNGMPFLQIDNHNISSLLQSFRLIGAAVGKTENARKLIASFREKISAQTVKHSFSPGVLLVVGRSDIGSGSIGKVWAAGSETVYDGFLEIVGADNCIDSRRGSYQMVSVEGIITLAPEVIIDISSVGGKISSRIAESDWYGIRGVPAVEDSLIFCIDSSYTSIPGPRIVRFLDDISAIMHRAQATIESG